MLVVNVIDRPASVCLDYPMAWFIGPTTGPGIYEGPTAAQAASSKTPSAPTMRRDLVQKPFSKPQRATGASDRAVHVPRIHEILGARTFAPENRPA